SAVGTLINFNSLISREMVAWVTVIPTSPNKVTKSSWRSTACCSIICLISACRLVFFISSLTPLIARLPLPNLFFGVQLRLGGRHYRCNINRGRHVGLGWPHQGQLG